MTDEAPEHSGLPVPGYKPQPQEAIDLVTEGKYIEEIAMRFLDQLEALAYSNHLVGTERPGLPGVHATSERRPTGHVDPRFLALARTHLQTGFMYAARSVFQPTRVDIPSEFNFDHLLRK